jgi:hypothetical protein
LGALTVYLKSVASDDRLDALTSRRLTTTSMLPFEWKASRFWHGQLNDARVDLAHGCADTDGRNHEPRVVRPALKELRGGRFLA